VAPFGKAGNSRNTLYHIHPFASFGENLKIAALWSGGKDSCLSTYEAVSAGYEVAYLLSFNYEDGSQGKKNTIPSRPLSVIYNRLGRAGPSVISNIISFVYKDLSRMIPHEISPEIVCMQAQAMGIPIIQKEVRWDTFEQYLKSTMKMLKKMGIEGLVFGVVPPHYPIDSSEKLREYRTLIEHKRWMERLCGELDIKPITTLWESTPERILRDFVTNGFEAIIVVVDSKYFGREWLGSRINEDFIEKVADLNRRKNMHIGGSGYHTLVVDGPIFKKRLEIVRSKQVWRNGYGILDISSVNLVSKEEN